MAGNVGGLIVAVMLIFRTAIADKHNAILHFEIDINSVLHNTPGSLADKALKVWRGLD